MAKRSQTQQSYGAVTPQRSSWGTKTKRGGEKEGEKEE